ncbi:AlbA family DNA-binding domain-containing protein [Bradyrhizobium vignae]|uniref:AlbA family DNA-binding domain-containing protein n=1 Tax=Bradyrhizobium vignae TaxID=1549949 RepID=UPI00100C27EB|nr:ATP-binding protein [Bradyrhizobium vignae]RXG87676.1 ATP-binding protein [Bradyrhizobium vignae]
MFPTRLSEVTDSEVQAAIDNEAAETIDFELKRALPAKKGGDDPWMVGGKLGDEAKDELAAEIIAFANTVGGTLVVGIDEDTATKRAKAPILPIPRCKEAAARLHQAISDRVEPKLPVFECEGVVTEGDGASGVIILRTLESYLAPHRHTQNNHCYVRRNDRAEPMSMLEIQEMTRQKARSAADAGQAFKDSAERFFSWLPHEHQRIHPYNGLQGIYQPDGDGRVWVSIWALRVTARPLAPFLLADIMKQPWLRQIAARTFGGAGQIRHLMWRDLRTTRAWTPRLRAVERELEGASCLGRDRVTSEGLIERFIWQKRVESPKPRVDFLDITELLWNVACVVQAAQIIRSANARPTQPFALEIELMNSDPLYVHGYTNAPSATVPVGSVTFPKYEVGEPQSFDELMMTIDKDVWNLGGYHPSWEFSVSWPSVS